MIGRSVALTSRWPTGEPIVSSSFFVPSASAYPEILKLVAYELVASVDTIKIRKLWSLHRETNIDNYVSFLLTRIYMRRLFHFSEYLHLLRINENSYQKVQENKMKRLV